MTELVSLAESMELLSPLRDAEGLCAYIRECGCDGAEFIYCAPGAGGIATPEAAVGYHLMFYPEWIGFFLHDEDYIKRHFGTWETAYGYYRCKTAADYIDLLRLDMDRAQALGARYAVFHVSDVSGEEILTRRFEHTDAQVIETSAALLNAAMHGRGYTFRLLLENLSTPGMTLVDPHETERMLGLVEYANTGIMLDTGHLMCTNLALRNEAEAFEYVSDAVKRHGELAKLIYGVHLHKSVTGDVVRDMLSRRITPESGFYERFAQSYAWVRRIDPHLPVSDPAARAFIELVGPEYLVHELSADDLDAKRSAVLAQRAALGF